MTLLYRFHMEPDRQRNLRRYADRRTFLLFTVTLSVLLAGIFCWLIYREVRQSQRNNALIASVKRNDVQTVTLLLEQGASVDARDGTAQPLSFWRLALDRLTGRNALRPTGPTALMVAMNAQFARENRFVRHPIDYSPIAKVLVAKGADPNVANGTGETPLIIAAWLANVDLVRALLAHSAKVDTQDASGGTALKYATWGGSIECLQALLDKGAAVNIKDSGGNDALGGAADLNNLDMMRLLLDHGADPRAKNTAGTTALSLMVRHGNTVAVKLLLSRGADPGATDSMGRSCLFWLRGKPHSEIVALLQQAGATK